MTAASNYLGTRFQTEYELLSTRMQRLEDLLTKHSHFDQLDFPRSGRRVSQLTRDLRDARAELHRPYNLMVAGVQNAGKSTLLNVLLGEDLLPTSMKNVDGVLSVIEYGSTEGAEIVWKDGRREEASLERVLSLIDQRETAEARTRDDVDVCHIYRPNENLKTFRFVNTPGLQDRPDITDRTREFFAKADAVLWVFNSSKIAQTQIAEAVLGIAREHRHRVLAVMNKWDLVAKAGPEAESEVEELFEEIFRGCYSDVFHLVARDAAKAIGITKRQDLNEEERVSMLEDSGYNELVAHFEDNFFGKAKQREKVAGAEEKLEAAALDGLDLAHSVAKMAEAATRDEEGGKDKLTQLLHQIERNRLKVERDLYAVTKDYTGKLIDAYVGASDRAGKETIGVFAMFRGAESLAADFEEALEKEVERLLPRETFSNGLERDANNVILGSWLDFFDEVGEEFEGELDLSDLNVAVGNVNVSGAPIRNVLYSIAMAAIGAAVKLGTERLKRSGLKRVIQQVVRKVAGMVAKVIGKKLTKELMKQIAKKVNPILWLSTAADVKKTVGEVDDVLKAAREEVTLNLSQQRTALELQIHDTICEMNNQIAQGLEDAIKSKTSDFDAELRRQFELLEEANGLATKIEILMGRLDPEQSSSDRGADDFFEGEEDDEQ